MADMDGSSGAPGVNVHFNILSDSGEVDGYIHLFVWTADDVGLRKELIGTPRRVEITIARAGSIERALLHAWAEAMSVGLENGLPIAPYIHAIKGVRFEPAGFLFVNGKKLENRPLGVGSVLDAVAAILDDLGERNWKPRKFEAPVVQKVDVINGLNELVRRLTS